MFGGPPMMPAQQFAPQYAMPAPQYNVPAAMASTVPARPAPSNQPMTTTPPRPVVRAQAADAPAPPINRPPAPVAERPALVNLPAPEQLGVTAAGTVDWSATHARLDRLGVTCFQEEKLANGACRFSCVLPMNNGAQAHRIEAEASSAAEAVQLALAEAEHWKAGK
jgi:hypothetical protein